MKHLKLLTLIVVLLISSLTAQSQLPISCSVPGGLKAIYIGQTSATLTWNKATGGIYYTVEYGINSQSLTTVKATDTVVTITGLTAGTLYYWAVQTYCSNGGTTDTESGYSPFSNFTTERANYPCYAPTKFRNSNLTSTGVTLIWNKVSNACSYYIKYIAYGTTDTLYASSTDTTTTLTGLTPGTYYHWQVMTVCCQNTGTSAYSTYQVFTTLTPPPPPPCNCPVPTGLKATYIGQTSATLAWNKVTGGSSYLVSYGVSSTSMLIVKAEDTTITITGLTAGTEYHWQVEAYCANSGNCTVSGYSPLSSFTTEHASSLCNAPTKCSNSNLTYTGVTLIWNKVSGACSYNIKYIAYGTTDTIKTYTTDTTIALTGLIPGTYYHWFVQTVCCNGGTIGTTSPWSSYQIFTTPANCAVPINLKYSYLTSTSVVLSWDAVKGVYTYIVQYWTSGNVNNPSQVTVTTNSASITGLTPNTYYEWKVETYCGSGILSSWSVTSNFTTPQTTAPCNTPTGFITTRITQTGATIYWNRVDGACSYYVYYYATNNTTTAKEIITKDTLITLDSLLSNTSYSWKVKTLCCTGGQVTSYSGYGITQTFTTLAPPSCYAPTVFKLLHLTATSAIFTWNKEDGACGYIITYYIYTNPSGATKTITVKDTFLSVADLVPNTYYHWVVNTICCNGNQSTNGKYQIFTTPALPTCGIPAKYLSSKITPTSATIAWSHVAGACSYNIKYFIAYKQTDTVFLSTQDTSINLTGLTPATYYHWQVQTVCCGNIGNSKWGATQPLVTLSLPTCSAPTKFSNSNLTPTSVYLKWNKVEDACSYNLKYYAYGKTDTVTLYTKDTLYNVTGLTPGTYYHWLVQTVCCDRGTGKWGSTQIFTTPQESTKCAAPINLKYSYLTQTSVVLSWEAVSGAYTYIVQYWTSGNVNNPSSVTVTTNSASISGLTPNTYYEWKVTTYCGSGVLSEWSSTSNFTTLPATTATCNPPTGFGSKGITQTSAVIGWAAVTGACSYYVYYYPTNNISVPKVIITTQTTITLDSLQPNTYYSWEVKTLCCTNLGGVGSYSDYGPLQYFKTLAATPISCPTPGNLQSLYITQTTAVLSWGAVTGAASYLVEYWVSGYPNSPLYIQSTTNYVQLSGLTPNTTYVWQVKTYCSNAAGSTGYSSDWSPSITFITLAPAPMTCNTPSDPASIDITQTSVVLTWHKTAHACYYSVVYNSSNTSAITIYVNDTTATITGLTAGTTYLWKVQSICCDSLNHTYGRSDFTTNQYFTTLNNLPTNCLAPIALSSTNITQTSATVTWSSSNKSATYLVCYWADTTPNTLLYMKATDTTVTLTGLTPKTLYHWKVKAYCIVSGTTTNYSSDWSQTLSFTTLPAVVISCGTPTKLETDNITQTTALLKWNKIAGATSYIVTYYPINNPTTSKSVNVTDTTYQLTGLTASTAYEWKVVTRCCGNTPNTRCYYSDPSTPYDFQTFSIPICNKPEGLISTYITQTSAVLSWNAAPNACYYIVDYMPEGTSQTSFLIIYTKDTTVTLTNLIANTKYDWKVQTLCCSTVGGTSSYSDFTAIQNFTTLPIHIVQCNTPTNLSTNTITSSSAVLIWSHVASACYYLVEYWQAGNSTTQYMYVKATDTTVTLTGLLPNTAYEWKVQTICCNNGSTSSSSGFSESVTFTTLAAQVACNAPTSLYSTAITQNSATLKWNPITNACGYLVVYYMGDSTSPAQYIKTTVNYVNLTGLTQGKVYYWKVQTVCCNQTGAGSYSDFSALQYFTTLVPPIFSCNPPTLLATNSITNNSAILNWNTVDRASKYIVYLWTANTTPTYQVVTTATYIAQNLQPSTTYMWKVQTVCYSNASSTPYYSTYSDTITFVTLPQPVITCATPTGLTSTGITTVQADISWAPLTTAVYYIVDFKPATGDSTTEKYFVTQTNQYLLSGLTQNTIYRWRVRSVCSVGSNLYTFSDYSQPNYFTTLAENPSCSPPERLYSYDVIDTTANLSWNAVSGVNLYEVIYYAANSNISTYKIVSDVQLALTGLKPTTKYIWRVGSICSATGGYSQAIFSDTASFITKPKHGKSLQHPISTAKPLLNFTVYPNPTEGIFNVQLENVNTSTILTISNITGQVIHTETLNNSGNYLKQLDLSGVAKGIYFIKVINNDTAKTLKLVVH